MIIWLKWNERVLGIRIVPVPCARVITLAAVVQHSITRVALHHVAMLAIAIIELLYCTLKLVL